MGTVTKKYNVWDAQIQRGILNFSLSVTNLTNGIRVDGYVEVRGADLPLNGVKVYMPDNSVINATYTGDTVNPSTYGQGVSQYLGKYTFSGSASVAVNSAYSVRVVGENGSTSTVSYRFISPDESNFVSTPELNYEDVLAEPIGCTISLRANNVYAPGGSVVINCSSTGPVETGVLKRYYTEPGSGSGSSFKSTVIRSNVIGKASITDTIPSNLSGAIVYWRYDVSGTSGSAYAVTGERRISSNAAPSTPETLTIPNSLAVGSAFQISWSASTDPDNNLAGYILERSVDSGESWVTVFKGNALSCSDTLPQYTTRVRYQVRAYDTENAESGPRYAPSTGDATVSTNHAPTTPSTLTLTPATLTSGVSAVISWGESTDEDTGDTIVYSLERSTNNSSSYQEIYRGTSRTRTDTIGEWTRVYYRVRAIDNHGAASSYKSLNRAVTSNAAPTIVCQSNPFDSVTPVVIDDGDSLGTTSETFSIYYKVNDANGAAGKEPLTVKEYVDGAVKKTYTASFISAADRYGTQEFNFKTAQNVSYWKNLSDGQHFIKISVSDGTNTTNVSFIFTKDVNSCLITLKTAVESVDNIDTVVLSICGDFPSNLLTDVQVTADNGTHWEQCFFNSGPSYGLDNRKIVKLSGGTPVGMMENLIGRNLVYVHKMTNTGKYFNFKIYASKVNGVGGHISSVQGTFINAATAE